MRDVDAPAPSVDAGAASARPGCWCRRTCRQRCRRSTAGLAGLVRRAGDGDEARLALDQQVVGLLVAVGPGCGRVVAVARDVADDQVGPAPSAHRRTPSAPPRPAPGSAPPRRPVHDQPRSSRAAAWGASGPASGFPCCGWSTRSARPGRARAGHSRGRSRPRPALDLDHARAQVGQLAGGERRRDGVFQRDDGQMPFSGCMQACSGRSVATASIVSQPSWSCAHSLTVLPSAPAVDLHRRPSKVGRTALKRKAATSASGSLAAQQVHQQRGDQRAVHDQARVALDLGDVGPVVVDAVAVEGQRAVAEQQHIIGHPGALPGAPVGAACGGGSTSPGFFRSR
jgi:hypothetical protein